MTFTLKQTGDAPVRFDGEVIAQVGGSFFREKEVNRWYELSLYRSKDKYILSISYRTQWKGEPEQYDVFICSDPECVRSNLQDWNPIIEGIGYPPHPNYKERQERLITALESQYDELVSELLIAAGKEFAVSL